MSAETAAEMNKTKYHLRADLQGPGTPILGAADDASPRGALSPSLTQQERRVVAELMRGLSNRQIARALSLSQYTVKFHLKNVFTKWGVRSRVEVILRFASERSRAPVERYAVTESVAAIATAP